jgi:hypothetical protein
MKLKAFASLLGVLACVALTFAATRATFILTNGQRASGELVFHGGQGNNMIDNQLNLGNAGQEKSYPVDQVAVIDIVGGTPSQDELGKALASDQSMVLRNGFVQGGHFVNIQNGNTLIWRNDAGQEQHYGLEAVTRVYLNTQSARQLFNYTAPAAPPPSPPIGTGRPAPVMRAARTRGNALVVPGTLPWVDTGILVNTGDRVTFHATGRVGLVQGEPQVGPEGKTGALSDKYPLPAMQNGALIGRVGTGQPFPIGSQQTPIPMPGTGTLQLGINDDFFPDNSGAFEVSVTVNGRPR